MWRTGAHEPTLYLHLPTLYSTWDETYLQYASEGIWTSKSSPPMVLSPPIITIFDYWRISSSLFFCIFQKYYQDSRHLCTSELLQGRVQFFLHKPSLNKCKDNVQTESARTTLLIIAHLMKEDKDSLSQLEGVLMPDPSLLNMSRLHVLST